MMTKNEWNSLLYICFLFYFISFLNPLVAQETNNNKEENKGNIEKKNIDSIDELSTEEYLSTKSNKDQMKFENKADKARVGLGAYLQMFVVLAFVLFLIFIFFYLSKSKLRKNLLGLNGVEVLAKTSLLPRQTILIVKIGPRVLILNATSDGSMRTLAEFTDPDEIAKLLLEINKNSRDNIFQSLLTRNQVLYDEEAGDTEKKLNQMEKQADKIERN